VRKGCAPKLAITQCRWSSAEFDQTLTELKDGGERHRAGEMMRCCRVEELPHPYIDLIEGKYVLGASTRYSTTVRLFTIMQTNHS
ncbi:hypothetical protein HaLaN_32563, partial [Haematococcus lacustris]